MDVSTRHVDSPSLTHTLTLVCVCVIRMQMNYSVAFNSRRAAAAHPVGT
jgi:hypothetical protein